MATVRRAVTLVLLLAATASAQSRITSPKEEFGFNFGDDYQLATTRRAAYWPSRSRVGSHGRTGIGKTQTDGPT